MFTNNKIEKLLILKLKNALFNHNSTAIQNVFTFLRRNISIYQNIKKEYNQDQGKTYLYNDDKRSKYESVADKIMNMEKSMYKDDIVSKHNLTIQSKKHPDSYDNSSNWTNDSIIDIFGNDKLNFENLIKQEKLILCLNILDTNFFPSTDDGGSLTKFEIKYFFNFLTLFCKNSAFYPNKSEIYIEYKKIISKFINLLDLNKLTNDKTFSKISQFLTDFENHEYKDPYLIHIFYISIFEYYLSEYSDFLLYKNFIQGAPKKFIFTDCCLNINLDHQPFLMFLIEYAANCFNKNFSMTKKMDITNLSEFLFHMDALIPISGVQKESDSLHKCISNLDLMIEQKLVENPDQQVINWLTYNFSRNIYSTSKRVFRVFPSIHSQLCKIFNFQKSAIADNPDYLLYHCLFINRTINPSYTVKLVNNLIISNGFFIADQIEKNFENFLKLPTTNLINIFKLLSKLKIEEKSNLLINEILARADDSVDLFESIGATDLLVLVASMVNLEIFDLKFFKRILSDPKFYLVKNRKQVLNYGFNFSIAQLDNIVLWRLYFKHVKTMTGWNAIDNRMIKQIVYNLKLCGKHYNEFENIFFMTKVSRDEGQFRRWFQSQDLGSYSFADVAFVSFFKKYKIIHQPQVKVGQIFLVDFLLGDSIILNLNGPAHYFNSNRFKLDIKSIRISQIYESLGYKVINIHISSTFTNIENSDVCLFDILKKIKDLVGMEKFTKIFADKGVLEMLPRNIFE
jgi:hypothetical protein